MKQLMMRNQENKLKALAIYQIAGGVLGLGITIWVIAHTPVITGLLMLIFLVALGLYTYSVLCGILLVRQHKHGLKYSLINQYLQLVNFAILGFGLKYVSGMLLSVGVDLTGEFEMKFNFAIMSTWEFNVNRDVERIEINLNLFALFIIIFIDRLKKGIIQAEAEIQFLEPGI